MALEGLTYTDAELKALNGDVDDYVTEQGGQPEPDQSGTPEYSEAERRYFETGDVTSQLQNEYGVRTHQPAPEREISPKVLQLLESAKQLQAEREGRARAEARVDLLREALEPERPQQQPQYDSPEVPGSRYRDETKDPIGALYDVVNHAREVEADRVYINMIAEADRMSGGEFGQAYRHAIGSHTAELMARRYPNDTVQQIWQRMATPGGIPDDIRRQVEADERSTWGRNPNALADIIRFAQGRGWRSQATIKAARDMQAEQDRRVAAHRAEQQRKAEEREQDWRRSVARKCEAVPGVDFADALRQVLPNREDRVRYYQGARAYQSSGVSRSGANGW
jgi:hypothetical protein